MLRSGWSESLFVLAGELVAGRLELGARRDYCSAGAVDLAPVRRRRRRLALDLAGHGRPLAGNLRFYGASRLGLGIVRTRRARSIRAAATLVLYPNAYSTAYRDPGASCRRRAAGARFGGRESRAIRRSCSAAPVSR